MTSRGLSVLCVSCARVAWKNKAGISRRRMPKHFQRFNLGFQGFGYLLCRRAG